MSIIILLVPDWKLFTPLDAMYAAIFMRGLILWPAWGEMGSYSMHRICLEVQFLLLYHLILDLWDFSPHIL